MHRVSIQENRERVRVLLDKDPLQLMQRQVQGSKRLGPFVDADAGEAWQMGHGVQCGSMDGKDGDTWHGACQDEVLTIGQLEILERNEVGKRVETTATHGADGSIGMRQDSGQWCHTIAACVQRH